MKHTPGPWQVGKVGSVVGILIWRGDEPDNTNYSRICRNVATTADADLIAAAPDLLSALQAYVADDDVGARLSSPKLKAAKAAIAKATGKA